MKIKPNLQIELLIILVGIIILTFSGLFYTSVKNQRDLASDSFRDLAITLAQALDAGIATKEQLREREKLQSNIYKIMWLNPNITKISISLPTEDGLTIFASNDFNLIGASAVEESGLSYEKGLILTKAIIEPEGDKVLRVITPVHVGGQRVGTYDIRLSLDSLEETISKNQRWFLLTISLATILIIGALFISIRILIVGPVKKLRDGMNIIAAGNLDYRIEIKRKDEMGDLAIGFNEMAQKLKEKTKDLEREKTGLEEKVRERTKELQERIDELEKFRKLIVGRELKMRSLKQELGKLKRGRGEV